MSKSELLADEIETKKIELLQDRIDNNSKMINDLTNKLVADYCKQLDEYVKYSNPFASYLSYKAVIPVIWVVIPSVNRH